MNPIFATSMEHIDELLSFKDLPFEDNMTFHMGNLQFFYSFGLDPKGNKLNMNTLNQAMKDYINSNLDEKKTSYVIFVLNDSKARESNTLDTPLHSFMNQKQIKYDIFYLNEVMFNVTNHVLVPDHSILPGDEKRGLLDKFNLKSLMQIPYISSNDPVVRFIGGKEGDVIKIIRNPKSSGEHVLYRYCVSV